MPILRDSIVLSKRNAYLQTYVHQLCRKGFIGISHTTTSSGGTQALMEIIRLIYWIGIAANKCVAKVVSLVRYIEYK